MMQDAINEMLLNVALAGLTLVSTYVGRAPSLRRKHLD